MLTTAHSVISQLHLLHISKCVSWVLRIPVLSVSCCEAVTLVIKPCALIPNSVHMCCTLVPEMLCHLSHGTDCPKCGKVLRLPLRSYRLYNWLSQLRFDRVQHMCTESRIRAQGLITRVTASWQLTDNTGIRSTQLTLLLMCSMCSWLMTPCAAASTQCSY